MEPDEPPRCCGGAAEPKQVEQGKGNEKEKQKQNERDDGQGGKDSDKKDTERSRERGHRGAHARPRGGGGPPSQPCLLLAGADLLGMHRELAGYYRQFGFLDSSTPQALAERVIYPSCVMPPAHAHPHFGHSAHSRKPA